MGSSHLAQLRRVAPVLALIIVVGGVWAWTLHEIGRGRAIERESALEIARTVAKKKRAIAITEFVHDTVTLTRVIDRSGGFADSARQLIASSQLVADSLQARVGYLAADSARADSALVYVLAQNDTLRRVVVAVVAQRDSIAFYARRAVFSAAVAVRAADSLATVHAAIADAVRASSSCRVLFLPCPSRTVVAVLGVAAGLALAPRLR